MKSLAVAVVVVLALASVAIAADKVTSGYGPEKAKQQSGYITVPGFRKDNGTHIYYWFFESRNAPETAPLVFWFTGGPGCSGLTALFLENGPYKVDKNLQLSINPYSWNEVANVLFIDQPVGTGFSYADSMSDYTTDEDQIAFDLYQFLQLFLVRNPQYANSPFFITGESYAGHYNSHFSSYIVKQNAEGKNPKINLQGVAIGNGWVDPKHQYAEYGNYMYDKGFLSGAQVSTYNNYTYPLCKDSIDSGAWTAAMSVCQSGMMGVLMNSEWKAGRTINVYDVRIPCKVPPLCYDMSPIANFLNQANVKTALGIDTSRTWAACNNGVHMMLTGDWIPSFAQDIPTVLQAGVRVLIYSGTEDFVCNYYGGANWTKNMKWGGQGGFNAAQLKNWVVGSSTAGRSKSYMGLTWLEVDAAGHMVPLDQPENALDMLTRFLTNKPFA